MKSVYSDNSNQILADGKPETTNIKPEDNATKLANDKAFLQKSNDSFTRNSVSDGITDKSKKIRINNTFATASKTYKENFTKNWNLVLEKASNNSDYVSIAGMMSDIDILVVGEKNVIFLAQYDSLLERLFFQIQLIEKLLLEVFGIPYKIVFLLKDEWEFEKSKYVNNLKMSKKYTYIEEEENFNTSSANDEDIDKLVSILGTDVIKYQ